MSAKEVIGPKSPKQEMMLAVNTDIALLGGSAGSSKSYMALLSVLKYCNDPAFRGIIFRKTTGEITAQGGLWETAQELYGKIFGKKIKVRTKPYKITFPSGGSLVFSHMEHEKDRFTHQGAQYSYIIFDEATHFSRTCVEYLGTRLRSAKAVHKMQILMTCNPDCDHWLLDWVKPYLQKDGTPDLSKDGMIRYFVVEDGKYRWADTRKELEKIYGTGTDSGIQSFTFVSATCQDNPVLLSNDPGYIARLKAKPFVEMQRLLLGNWFVRESTSGWFKREWVEEVGLPPLHTIKRVRAWDIAGTLPSDAYPNPDWTVGVAMSKSKEGIYCVEDVVRFRDRPHGVLEKILRTAEHDGQETMIIIPADPGAAGKAYAAQIIKDLAERGFYARIKTTTTSKVTRFAPFAAVAEAKQVQIVRGDWNTEYYAELERFDGSRNVKDDQVDATGDAFMHLATSLHIPNFHLPPMEKANPFSVPGILGR